MARIKTYNNDTLVSSNDRWIGTDGDNFDRTKNFSPLSLAGFFNSSETINSANSLTFTYQTLDPLEQRALGTISFKNNPAPQFNFSSINTIMFSSRSKGLHYVDIFLQDMVGYTVILHRDRSINDYGLYQVVSVVEDESEPDFFNVGLLFLKGNGYLQEDKDYLFSVIQIDLNNDEIPTSTSQLTNDGEDGVNPFITALDVTIPTLQQVLTVGDRDVDGLVDDYEIVPTDRNKHWITDVDNVVANIEIEITNASFFDSNPYSVYIFTNTTDFDVTFVNNSDYTNVGTTNLTIVKGQTAHVHFLQPLGQFWINYLTNGLSSGGATPTLQQVLDNNHDLVNGIFNAGTDAGNLNTGINQNALGSQAGLDNVGDNQNAMGSTAGANNTGDNQNAFGVSAGNSNTGANLNALGSQAGKGNSGDNVNALGNQAGFVNGFNHVNLFGENAQADEDGQTVLSKDGTIMARISTTGLTDTRKYTLQDNSGTLAFTSDIPTNTSQLINDGEDGTSPYVTLDQLPSNLNLFATNASSDIATYFKLVTSISDTDYNTIAVDIPTGDITTTGQFIAALATEANVLVGNPGIINLLTIGNVRRTSGSGTAEFYYEVYHRDSGGTETLITTSDTTPPVSAGVYTEFLATALLNNGIFVETDRIVIKYYANRIGSGSNPEYDFQFGGTAPVRTTFPVPASNLPFTLGTLADISISGVTAGDILVYNDGLDVWENQSPNFIEKSVGPTYTTNAILTVTQAEYDALTPDPTTLYVIL
jgi:hypothetical protein